MKASYDEHLLQLNEKLSSLPHYYLKIYDVSYQHKGHKGYNTERPSHIIVEILSDSFENMSLLDRHRLVLSLLSEELSSWLHSVSVRALAPKTLS